MTVQTIRKRMYEVVAAQACTVKSPDGMVLCKAAPGERVRFIAPASSVILSDESAQVSPVSEAVRRQKQVRPNPVIGFALHDKYAACANVEELVSVRSNYMADVEGGVWKFSLAALEYGDGAFLSVVALRDFLSPLPNLKSARNMFYGCVLSVNSVTRIAESVPEVEGAVLTLGIDIRLMHSERVKTALLLLENKGWLLEVQYNTPVGVPTLAELEYLESNGKQYIDTEIVPLMDTRMYIDVDILKLNTGVNSLFGVRNYIGERIVFYDVYYNDEKNIGLRPYILWSGTERPDSRFTMEFTGSDILLNGVSVKRYTPENNELSTANKLRLFAMNYGNGTVSQYATARMYAFRLYSPSEVLLDLIPVLDETGTPCMFDKVKSNYLYNSGNVAFKWALKSAPMGLRARAVSSPVQLPQSPVFAKRIDGIFYWCHYASDTSGWSRFSSVNEAENMLQ